MAASFIPQARWQQKCNNQGMSSTTFFSTVLAASALFAATLTAQNDSKDKMGQMKAQMKAKMQAKMKDKQGGMMDHHSEITQLVDKLAQSFAAVQAEKDPAQLAKKIAEHGAILKELQTKMAEHEKMMAAEEKAAPAKAAEETPVDPHAGHHE